MPFEQSHAGHGHDARGRELPHRVWHSTHDKDENVLYWSGDWGYRTPLQLLRECESTVRDLKALYPGLGEAEPWMTAADTCPLGPDGG